MRIYLSNKYTKYRYKDSGYLYIDIRISTYRYQLIHLFKYIHICSSIFYVKRKIYRYLETNGRYMTPIRYVLSQTLSLSLYSSIIPPQFSMQPLTKPKGLESRILSDPLRVQQFHCDENVRTIKIHRSNSFFQIGSLRISSPVKILGRQDKPPTFSCIDLLDVK